MDSIMEALNSIDPRLPAYALQVLRLCLWLVILATIFAPLERLFALHPNRIFRKAIVTDLGYYFISNLAPGVLLGLPLAILAWSVHRFIPSGFTSAMAGLPLGLRIAASMLVGEIGFYWGHRWTHEIPLLWRFHAIHHSAQHIDFLVNTRAHPVDMVFTRLCGLVPLYVLGLAAPVRGSSSLVPLLVVLVGTLWGFFIHANVRWRFGPLEWLIATPAFHHWHHTNDGPAYINKNYSPMWPWVDRIFGTLYLPKDKQPQRYGIDQPVSPVLFGQLVDPFLIWHKNVSASPGELDPGHTPDASPVIVLSPASPEGQPFSNSES
jgi:sterol desaturase/sphingolipid hydroxylase (fatty acid hydroxylase superfamily)